MFLPHYRANKKRAPSNRILPPPSPPPPPSLYDQSLNARSNIIICTAGRGGTPFVQVVGEIRGLILELEKYFLCEPLRAPTQTSVMA